MNGGDAFKHLLRLIASQFKHEERGDALTTLNAFGVPNGTTFGEFLRQYRTAVHNITHYSSLFSLDETGIVGITHNKINGQFSVMMSDLFPGAKRTTVLPYCSLDEMWRVLNEFTTSKVKAENGEQYASLSLAGLSLHSHSGSRSHGRSATPSQQSWSSQGARSTQVMRVKAEPVHDVFFVRYECWPLASDEHWETVHAVVSNGFKQQLPPLWSPLLRTREKRANAFRENVNRCLNCRGHGHSVKTCEQPFTNASGVLNPDLRTSTDGKDVFRLWQERLRSWRTKPDTAQSTRQSSNQQSNRRRSHRPAHRQYAGNAQNSLQYSPTWHQQPPQGLLQSSAPTLQHTLVAYQPNAGTAPASVTQAPPNFRINHRLPADTNPNARNPGTFNAGN